MEAGRENPSPLAEREIVRAASLLALSPLASFVAPCLHAVDNSRASLRALTKSWRPVESDTACMHASKMSRSLDKLSYWLLAL